MKYGKKCGLDPSITIKNYEKEKDKIVISYLDGSKYKVSATEEIEQMILTQMEAQANKYVTKLDDVKKAKYLKLAFAAFGFFSTAITARGLLKSNSMSNGKIVATTSAAISIGLGINILLNKRIYQDLKKYNIYLRKKEKIEKYSTHPNLLNGLEKKEKLSINTLDNYTLKDMEIIENNIKRINMNSDIYKEDKSNVKVFTKKQ